MGTTHRQTVVLTLLTLSVGCNGGPFKREVAIDAGNPSRATYYERVAELRSLEDKVAKRPAAEQAAVVERLTKTLREDTNPLIRAQAVRVLANVEPPAAETALNLAESDGDTIVRQEVCLARGQQRTREGLRALARILANDEDTDVRMSATRQLRNYRDVEAYQALLAGLKDSDPAMQRLAMESLQIASGEDLGNDVAAWQTYVNDGKLPESSGSGWPSWASLKRRRY